jgi:asparagine synthase (glutamine-hydrolysing)
MEPYLSRDLLYRPKQGFTVPLARWFRHALREEILALPHSPWLRDSGIVNTQTVAAMVHAHMRGARDHSKALWLVWSFEAFLRQSARKGVTVLSGETANLSQTSQRPRAPAISAS